MDGSRDAMRVEAWWVMRDNFDRAWAHLLPSLLTFHFPWLEGRIFRLRTRTSAPGAPDVVKI